MSQILVRGLTPETVERLKRQARLNRRSLQGEVKTILEEAVVYSGKEALAVALEWRNRLSGRRYGDSARIIREDRNR
jgi:plasmid stability protein